MLQNIFCSVLSNHILYYKKSGILPQGGAGAALHAVFWAKNPPPIHTMGIGGGLAKGNASERTEHAVFGPLFHDQSKVVPSCSFGGSMRNKYTRFRLLYNAFELA